MWEWEMWKWGVLFTVCKIQVKLKAILKDLSNVSNSILISTM